MHLVIGAGGAVGRQLVTVLGSRAPVRTWDGQGDLGEALAGVSVVFSCAPPGDPTIRLRRRRGPSPELAAVVALAGRAGVHRLVHLSSTQVYGRPGPVPFTETSPPHPAGILARLAWQDERWLLRRAPDLEVVVVRAAQLFGPGERLSAALAAEVEAGRLRLPRHGWSRRSFIHVTDAARALVAAAERGRHRLPYLASGFTSSWHALCEELLAARGLPGKVRLFPYPLAYALAAWRELTTPAGARCWPTREVVKVLAQGQLVDDSFSRRELTWSPQVGSFAEAVSYAVPTLAPRAAAARKKGRVRVSARRGRSRS